MIDPGFGGPSSNAPITVFTAADYSFRCSVCHPGETSSAPSRRRVAPLVLRSLSSDRDRRLLVLCCGSTLGRSSKGTVLKVRTKRLPFRSKASATWAPCELRAGLQQ